MRLFEAIVEANHRAVNGDASAGLHPAEYATELPIGALTCMDPRLNTLLPQALGVPEEEFVWIRNAGNVVTGPCSSTARSMALACAVREARELVVIGHTDCRMGQVTMLQLLEKFKERGVERQQLPENLNEWIGSFASERTNVIRSVEHLRQSPFVGSKTPVHGLLIDVESGRLEWVVNGYEQMQKVGASSQERAGVAQQVMQQLERIGKVELEELKVPEARIGEVAARTEAWIQKEFQKVTAVSGAVPGEASKAGAGEQPPLLATEGSKLPLPPIKRPRIKLQREQK